MRETERIAGGTLLFGPGDRLNRLIVLVRATSPEARARQLADLDELGGRRADAGLLLVDADLLPVEDLGYLRRFLSRNEGFQITLVGEDPSRRVARSLLRLPRVQWLGWPPDIEDLQAFAGTPAPARRPAPSPLAEPMSEPPAPVIRPATRASGPEHSSEDELDRIEAILDLPEPPAEEEPETESAGTEALASEAGSVGMGGPVPPPYFRDQVADLADIVQRIEGGLATLREQESDASPAEGESVEALSSDVARLAQFTRTLSYLSAAPPRGDQRFDLAELVETLVSGMPKKGPASPRWLVRSSGPLPIHSDKELLLQVFDALLYVAEKCSGRSDIVRVQATQSEADAEPRAHVTIEFAAGPLAEIDPARVVEPYGLRRVLPDLGPNALSAALRIVQGQGGELRLASPARGRLSWILGVPMAAGASGSPAPAADRRPARGAADPFA